MSDTPYKILILVTRGGVGGSQMSVINLARALKARGQEVTVGFGDGQFLERECLASGIPFHRFDALKRTLNPIPNIMFVWRMKKLLDAEPYDVIHINSSNALFAAIGARLSKHSPRTVFTFRGLSILDEGYRNRFIQWLAKGAFRFFMMFVDVPVFVSRANYEKAVESGIVQSEKGVVIHNGLDPEKLVFFDRASAREDLSSQLDIDVSDRFLVGSIGRLAYQKNYEFLISEAASIVRSHPEVLMVIIGGGPDREKLTQLLTKHGVESHVILVGEIPNASRFLRAFDVFVLPSRYEGLSITLIETLFAGVPVLATDVGGAREQFSHAPFQVYPLNDAEEFQKRLTRLIDNPGIREELAGANRERSADFHIETTAEAYQRIYVSDHE